MKKILYYVCILALCITQISCGKQKDTVQNTEETADAKVQIERITYSEKDLQTGYTDAVELTLKDGEDIQITEGGTYRLTGTLEEGQILVDVADEDVRLVLAGVEVQNNGSAALYVREAKNVYVTLDAGTENILSAAGEFVQTDENNVDAAVFSKSDLIMNGTGSLTVHCETGHGIVTKDDLTITGGTFDVTAAGQCIVGKDSVAVADGIFTLTGGKDGIHSEHEDTAKGNVCLDGGTFTIRTDGDGVSASGTMLVTGGTYDILTGGGSANAVQSDGEDRMGGGMQMPGGMGGRGDRGDMGGGMMPGGMDRPEGMPEGMMPGEIPQGMELPEGMMPGEMPEGMVSGGMQMPSGSMPGEIPDTAEQATQTTDTAVVDSCKGLKAGGSMAITGGSFIIDTADDAIHTNADLSVAGGTFTLSSGDDGIHGDGNVEISAGTVEILTSYEGIEGQTIHLAGGEITLTASDDGLNAAGGNDSSGFGGFFGGKDMFAADADAGVTISGGTLVITAAGDGVILAINKIDSVQKDELLAVIDAYSGAASFDAIIPISAKTGDGVDLLLAECKKYAIESPFLFPDDITTDQPERQVMAEIIREKLLWCLDREIPHGTAVEITKFSERDNGIIDIDATIYCEKANHKGIIIGKHGDMLKKISSMSRADCERFMGTKVYLTTWVKVKENWRDSDFLVRNFGYRE